MNMQGLYDAIWAKSLNDMTQDSVPCALAQCFPGACTSCHLFAIFARFKSHPFPFFFFFSYFYALHGCHEYTHDDRKITYFKF